MRACTQEYKVPGTDIVLKRNDLVSFCNSGYHSDPRYYSHPDQFYPEHFSVEEKATRSPLVQLILHISISYIEQNTHLYNLFNLQACFSGLWTRT